MNKQQIHRLALLAAAKITFVAVPGCQSQPAGRARALSATPVVDVPVPRPSSSPTAAPAPTPVMATVAPRPVYEPAPAVDRVAACDALLKTSVSGVPFQRDAEAWACCSEPGMRDKYAFCTPWGPPAPPAMPKGWA